MTSTELLKHFDLYFRERGSRRSSYVSRMRSILSLYEDGTDLEVFLTQQSAVRKQKADKSAIVHFNTFLGTLGERPTTIKQVLPRRNASYDESILKYIRNVDSSLSPSILAILVKHIASTEVPVDWLGFFSERTSNPGSVNHLATFCLKFLDDLKLSSTGTMISIQGVDLETADLERVIFSLGTFLQSRTRNEEAPEIDTSLLYGTTDFGQTILFLLLEVGLTKQQICTLTTEEMLTLIGVWEKRISILKLSMYPVDHSRPKAKAFPMVNSAEVDLIMKRAMTRIGLSGQTFTILRKQYRSAQQAI